MSPYHRFILVTKLKTCNDCYFAKVNQFFFEIIHVVKLSKFQALGVNPHRKQREKNLLVAQFMLSKQERLLLHIGSLVHELLTPEDCKKKLKYKLNQHHEKPTKDISTKSCHNGAFEPKFFNDCLHATIFLYPDINF